MLTKTFEFGTAELQLAVLCRVDRVDRFAESPQDIDHVRSKMKQSEFEDLKSGVIGSAHKIYGVLSQIFLSMKETKVLPDYDTVPICTV